MVLSMDRWRGKVAVITGAGGGIGEAVVKHLIDENLQVIAIDNRSDSLDELSKKIKTANLHTYTVDLSQDDEVIQVFKRILEEIGPIHILINCAGLVQNTNLTGGNVKQWRKIFDVNVIGLCNATNEATKIMKDNKIDGHIIHIGSDTGQKVYYFPGINVYGSSKHAVKALAETLRLEFNHMGLKIKITHISPGAVDTQIAARNNIVLAGDMFEKMPKLNPADIADAVVYTLSTPPHVQVHEIWVKPLGEEL